MYMDKCVEISCAANGCVIGLNVPLKPDAKKTDKMLGCCSDSTAMKQYIAKDAKEVADLIEDILPLLDQEFKTEDEFNKAFDEATNEMSAEEKGEGE